MHPDQIRVDVGLVRELLRRDRPEWADRRLERVGAGTDNTMYRLGGDLVVRVPRTAGTARALVKERTWLPRLAPHLPVAVPEPVHAGAPQDDFPLPWSVYRWQDGDVVSGESVGDWSALGRSLAEFVTSLRAAPLMGACRADGLDGYRGGSLHDLAEDVPQHLDRCRGIDGLSLEVDRLAELWDEALAAPEPQAAPAWLHSDLKPTNLLARKGRLTGVIDFGGLTVGNPTAEHAPVWDLPQEARAAYRAAVDIDDDTWTRARGWALAVAVAGIPYYWTSYPEFIDECLARLRRLLES